VEFLGAEDVLPQRRLMVTEGGEAVLRFRLMGLRENISDINRKGDQFRVQVDLTRIITTGQHTLDYDIVFPGSVSEADFTLDYVSTRTITVGIAGMTEKTIPVTLELTGQVADGHMVETSRLARDTLTLSGLQEDVSLLDHAVVTLDITGATDTVTRELNFRLYDREENELDPKLYRGDTETVEVTVEVLMIKKLPLKVSFIESPGSMVANTAHSISPDSITVVGDSGSLSTMENLVICAVDLSELTEDTTMEVPIPLPANSRLLEGETTATVTIGFMGLSTKVLQTTNISFLNPPERRTVNLVTKELDVTLRGTQEVLDGLTELNVRLVADLSDIPSASGNYAVPAEVYVDGTDQAGAIGQYQIVIRISK